MVTQEGREALTAQQTDQAFVWAVRLSHDDFAAPYRFTDYSEDVVYNGETYQRYPFVLATSSQSGEEPPRAQITIDNTEANLVEALRDVDGPIKIDIALVRAADTSVAEMVLPTMLAQDASYDLQNIVLELVSDALANETANTVRVSPGSHPAAFRGGGVLTG